MPDRPSQRPPNPPGEPFGAEAPSLGAEWRRATLFLGLHDADDLRKRLDDCGIIDRLAGLGFRSLHFEIEPLSIEGQSMRLYDEMAAPERLLMELRLRVRQIVPALRLVNEEPLHEVRMLGVEWGLLQNPRAAFTPDRPPLPDQRHPGLGLAGKATRLIEGFARDHHCDGVLSFPQHYHNAVIYAHRFVCFHPARQGALRAMMRDLTERGLAERSFAIDAGCLVAEPGGRSVAWKGSEMVLPISRRLADWVGSRFWRAEARQAECAHRWRIDWERFDRLPEKG